MADEVISSEEEYENPNFIFDVVRVIQITFLLVVIGAISSFFVDDTFSSRSVYDMLMLICMVLCAVTSMIIGAQICGSQGYAGNRQLLYSMGHKQRLRTYNRELLRRGHLGLVGIVWFASFILMVVAFSRWIIMGEI